MDLKDVILETLEELEEDISTPENNNITNKNCLDKEFLLNLRKKMLVLFEGLQSPNITHLEQKLDLTINFLEFVLSEIDKKLDERNN